MADTKSIEAILSARDKNFTSTMNRAMGSVSRLGKSVAKGVGFGSMMAVGQKAVSVVGNGVRSLVRDMDQTNAAWTTFTSNMKAAGHSTGEIKKATAEMKDFASKSIYYSSDMASTYAQLDAVGTKNTANLVKGFGAVASAAENPTQAMKSMSQQATQMAAKPTVAWQDFKIMMEQTPAGIAQVAKQMGMTTKELVASVQDGSVKTQDFFNAISKIGGNANHQLMKNATHYKTIGEAISGTSGFLMTKLAPAWSIVSKEAIKALGGIQGKISKIDSKVIEKKVSAGIDKAKEIFKEAKPIIKAFGTTMMGTGKAVMVALPYLAKIAPVLAPALVAFKGFQKVSGIVNSIKGIASGGKLLARFNKDSNDMIAIMQKAQLGSSGATGAFGSLKTALSGLISPAGAATAGFIALLGAIGAFQGHMAKIPGTWQNAKNASDKASSSLRETTKSYNELKTAAKEQMTQGLSETAHVQSLKKELDGLVDANGRVKKGYGQRAAAIANAISKATGIELKYTDGIVLGYEKAGNAIDKYIEKKRAQLRLEAGESTYKKAMEGQMKAQEAMNKAQKEMKNANKNLLSGDLGASNKYQKALADYKKYSKDMMLQEAAMAEYEKGHYAEAERILTEHTLKKNQQRQLDAQQKKAQDEAALQQQIAQNEKIAQSMGQGLNVEQALSQMITKANQKGIEVPKAVANGIRTGQYELPTTINGMSTLVKFDALAQKAQKAGVQIPQSVKSGVQSGSYAVPASINQLNALIKYDKMRASAQKAGVQIPEKIKNGIASGKMKPTEAVKAMNALVVNKTKEGTKKAGAEGKKVGSEYSKGAKSGGSKAASTAGTITKSVVSKLKGGASQAASAGRMISAGFAQGMNAAASAAEAAAERIVAAAHRAAEAKAQIGSPSKLFAKTGRWIALGLAKGIVDNSKAAKKAGTTIIHSAFSSMQDAVGKWSYTDLGTTNVEFNKAGESAYKAWEEGFANASEKARDKVSDKVYIKLNKRANKYQKKSKQYEKKANKYSNKASKGGGDKKKYKALAKKYTKLANKYSNKSNSIKTMTDTLVSQFESAYNSMTDKAKSAAQEQINAINAKYDQLYSDLKQKRDNFYSKLAGYESLFSKESSAAYDTYGFSVNGSAAGKIINFDEQTKQIKQYKQNLDALKKAGVSSAYLEEIAQSQSLSDGLALTNQLMAEGMNKAKAYGRSYETMINTANSLSSQWYKSDFEAIQKGYSADIAKVEADLKTQLDGIAKNTMNGFVYAINREIKRGTLGKAGKKAAKQIIKSLKKTLGIKSPSKVTAEIGMYTGKGMVKGLEKSEGMINRAMDNIVRIPTVRVPEMKSAVGAELSSDYRYGASLSGEIVIVTTLDGKVVAETTAPFTEEILNRRQKRENRKIGRL